MLLRRLYLLAAALVLACASTQAHAYAKAAPAHPALAAFAPPCAAPLQLKSALRACASLSEAAPGSNVCATPSRTKEICPPLRECTSTLGVTGYRKDEDTGLYYAQARWYDPLVGNFNGMDPAMGNSAQPITLNKYVYANGNPLIYIDPSGRAGFLTVMRNGFDRVDEGLRETAVAFPILADQIGVTRGAVALASTPTRMYNLASDVVAQALPGEALRGLSDQGSAELARTVDPMAGLAIDYANDPEGTKIRVAVKVGLAAKDKIVAAAGGDGGARSDIVSFGTQIALPIAGEAALANMGSKVVQSAGYLDDVSRINAQAAARQLERSADNVVTASGKGEQAADGVVVVESKAGIESATVSAQPTPSVTTAKLGRTGDQSRLRELAEDDKASSVDRGWINQELNSIERGQRTRIRRPPGKQLAHERGREAAKGYGYEHSQLQDKDLHKLQHKYDDFGRKNKERPVADEE